MLTIGAAAVVAFKDVGADLPAEQGASLVLDAVDVGVHHELWVKLVPFESDAADGIHRLEYVHDAHGVHSKAVDRGR